MQAFFRPDTAVVSRRLALAGIGSSVIGVLVRDKSLGQEPPTTDCPVCFGRGRLPLKDARPFTWLEPAGTPKWDAVVDEQICPHCQTVTNPEALVQEAEQLFLAALKSHRRWEELTGWKLTCAVTRHATLHSQLSVPQTRAAASALETLTLHLKRLTGSLGLTTTSPVTLELVLLLERSSWDAFRKVMETRFTQEQLGESWGPARELNAYDHFSVPHLYETHQTIRSRPPSCGVTFIVARRQLNRATDWKAPFWLAEGFAAYGDYLVHKSNRWFTTYAGERVPPGDWMAGSRKLVGESQHRDWTKFMRRDLRDWELGDHYQSMSMAAFLLASEPSKFLTFLRQLGAGVGQTQALESVFQCGLADVEERWVRWLLKK